jgi:TonB-linked SusC/RagA family outer membrane protein
MEKKRNFHGQSLWESKLLKVMKLTVLLMLISLMGVFASETYSQTTRLTVNANKMSLEDFLVKIENQSEFRFFYTGKIDVEQEVSGEFRNKKIFEVLDEIKDEAGFQYEVLGRQIILSPNDAEGAIKSIQQQKTVSGKVTDNMNQPLPGVTVMVAGTTLGIVTNADGNYTISNIPENATLQFSFVGMKGQEIAVGNNTTVNVIMEDETIGLEEVVAIGYGTQSKKKVTSAISKVDMEGVKDMPITTTGQILQGRASGVSVNDNNGRPGASPRITIHGISSINAGFGPLIVIDGFPVGTSIPESLNPNDIEQMTVLKDAASTSIYGARGSNGVILIETINADKSKTEIEYSVSEGFQYFPDNWRIPVLDALQYAQYNKERVEELNAYSNQNNAVPQIYLDVLNNPEAYNNSPTWQDYVFREGADAMLHNHNLTIKAGNEKLRAVVSGGYQKQNGILPSTDFQRFSFRTNITR